MSIRKFSQPVIFCCSATLAPIYLGDAVYEVLRSAAEDLQLGRARLYFAGFTYCLLCLALWHFFDSAMEAVNTVPQRDGSTNSSRQNKRILLFDLGLTGFSVAPLLGIALAVSVARAAPELGAYGNPVMELRRLEFVTFFSAIFMAAVIVVLSR